MAAERSTNLYAMKVQGEAREAEEKARVQRRKGAIVLIEHFLLENGYLQTLEKMQQESGVSVQKLSVADNISLTTVMQEFEEYFYVKFGRKPKFFRPVAGGDSAPAGAKGRLHALPAIERAAGAGDGGKRDDDDAKAGSARDGRAERPPRGPGKDKGEGKAKGGAKGAAAPPDPGLDAGLISGFSCLEAKPLVEPGAHAEQPVKKGRASSQPARARLDKVAPTEDDYYEQRLLKPLPDFGWNAELRDLAQCIQRDILMANPDVKFTDIASLDSCKLLLKEAIVMPIKYPQFFTGLLKPWKGILLFGPPGTGKTMLAKAVATECRTTFFNIAISTIVSKWRGDSEKLVRMLFDLARHYAPSTIFIDEIDSVMSKRSSSGSEHEGSRRMKTEVLVQMDGLNKSNEQVFVLAASNIPWDLDPAILRRLEKRIHVHLPTVDAREQMFRKNLVEVVDESTINFRHLALKTEGYSGADIDIVCREAAMRTLRSKMAKLEQDLDDKQLQKELVGLDKVLMMDLERALEVTKSAASNVPDAKYAKWESEFGSGVVMEDLN